MQPVPLTAYPQLDGTNNEALLRLVAGYEAALRKCNADKQMINDALSGVNAPR